MQSDLYLEVLAYYTAIFHLSELAHIPFMDAVVIFGQAARLPENKDWRALAARVQRNLKDFKNSATVRP